MSGAEASTTRELRFEGPYDLGRSLLLGDYGRGNLTLQRPNPGQLVRAVQTPEGPASVDLRVDAPGGRVVAEAFGPGRTWLLDGLPRQLGLDDRPPTLAGKLGRIQRRCPGVRMGRVPDLFALLASYVIRQRVAWRDAVASEASILRAHAEPAPGPFDLRVPLSAAQWLGLTTADLAGHGLERKRAKTILGLAARADKIRAFASLPSDAFARKLEFFTGVGPWTRAWVQGLGLAEPDAVPVGDYELPSMVAWLLAGEARADDARMLELLEPYAGQRFRAVQLIWATGMTAPRFGPRIRGVRP